jgi:acylphosphatase
MLATARIVVDGIVQGVGYRALVKQIGKQLGLKGLVRNLEETQVEIFCEGSEDKIREFLKQIDVRTERKDVLGINVVSIDAFWEGQESYRPAWKDYSGFEIDYQAGYLKPVEIETLESQEFAKLYFIGFRDEMKSLRQETNNNFKEMETKYGDISKELKEFRKTIEKFLETYLSRKT